MCKSPEVVKNMVCLMNRGLVWLVKRRVFQDESSLVGNLD